MHTPKPSTPLLLSAGLRSVPVSRSSAGTFYCRRRQIWLTADLQPVVAAAHGESNFGETTRTATREGVGQSDVSAVASDFGETSMTRTREGVDQTEVVASDFGETTVTMTAEGIDQSESASTSDLIGQNLMVGLGRL